MHSQFSFDEVKSRYAVERRQPCQIIRADDQLPGFVGCEHPIDAGAGGVSLSLPCGNFADETLGVVYSTVQALAAEHADLDLDYVEPTGMLGGVVELQAAQNSPGFSGREGLIEGAGRVGREVILHDSDARGIGI